MTINGEPEAAAKSDPGDSSSGSAPAQRGDAAQSEDQRVVESPDAFFSCRNIKAYYGDSYIVQDLSFEIAECEIVALLGRNGAGKTSTLRAIARAEQPALTSGEIYLKGKPVHEMVGYQASQEGIQLVPEDRRIIPGLTVEENLNLAQIAEPIGWSLDRIYQHFPRLEERRRQEGVTLSGGEQQMLAVARALARDIKLLLLDEPYEGLAPVIVREIENILQEVKEAGITTIIVEQNAIAALKLADTAIILDTGEIAFRGSAQEVLDNEELRHEYLAL
jgi:branched-chain amino acid transport system ATP-binding protein